MFFNFYDSVSGTLAKVRSATGANRTKRSEISRSRFGQTLKRSLPVGSDRTWLGRLEVVPISLRPNRRPWWSGQLVNSETDSVTGREEYPPKTASLLLF